MTFLAECGLFRVIYPLDVINMSIWFHPLSRQTLAFWNLYKCNKCRSLKFLIQIPTLRCRNTVGGQTGISQQRDKAEFEFLNWTKGNLAARRWFPDCSCPRKLVTEGFHPPSACSTIFQQLQRRDTFFHWLHDVWATIVAENTRQLQHFQVNHSPSSNYLEKCFPSSCSMACAWFAVSIKKCKFQEVDICICLQKLRNWTPYLQLSCEACAYRNIVPHCWNEPKHWIAEESRQKHHPQLQSFFNYFHFRRDVTTKYYCASRHQGWLTSLH